MRIRLPQLSKKEATEVIAVLGVLVVGSGAYLLTKMIFGAGMPREGDSCPFSVYQSVLVRNHGMSDAHARNAWTYMPYVHWAASYFGIDPTLLAGLIQTESGWNPNAGSSAGALGLTQHIWSTARHRFDELVAENRWPFDRVSTNNDPAARGTEYASWLDRTNPAQSVWLGAASLRSLLDSGKGVAWALAAYNGGPGVANKPQSQWPNETQNYVPGVLKRQGYYQELENACGRGGVFA
jgi:hypothetical protein